MFKSALCQIFVLLVFVGYSQERYTLTATIIDKNTKDKLPFATVSLKNPDSKAIIGGAVSDENGFVSVKSPLANVQIQVDYVGYETLIFEKSNIFGFLAIILASVNIFGGFLVTQRMLQMYKKKKDKKK